MLERVKANLKEGKGLWFVAITFGVMSIWGRIRSRNLARTYISDRLSCIRDLRLVVLCTYFLGGLAENASVTGDQGCAGLYSPLNTS